MSNIDEKVERINYLYKKSKNEGLTEAEKEEQKQLRMEYVNSVKRNLKSQLDGIKRKPGNKNMQ